MANLTSMLRRTALFSRTATCLGRSNSPCHIRQFSSSFSRYSDPFPSVLQDSASPLEVTTVLRSGKGFKIRTLQEPEPHTIHGNLIILEGEYFLWRPQLHSPQPGVLDIPPEA